MRWLVLLALYAAPAHAEGPSPLWDDVIHPNRLRCAELVDEARRRLGSRVLADKTSALELLSEAARLCPHSYDVLALCGSARLENGEAQLALPLLERARALDDAGQGSCAGRAGCTTRDARLAFNLGLARAFAGDLEGSLIEYRRAEEAGGIPDQWLLLYDLGDDLMALGRLTEAIDAYRRSVHARPNEVMPRLALSVALDRDEQLEKSRLELADALKIDPFVRDLASSHYTFLPAADRFYYVALTERANKRFGEARRALQAFLNALPESPYARRARRLLASLPL